MTRQMVTILGASGSIGASTLDVLARHPDRYGIFALTANSAVEPMVELCQRFSPRYAVLADATAAQRLGARLDELGHGSTEVLAGKESLELVAAHDDVHIVMAAIVGAAGLPSAMAAARAGKRLLLANKEALVMAGDLFMAAVEEGGATLLPVDSEHNAIFQCLPVDGQARPHSDAISGLVLTASGGPFRGRDEAFLARVTPEQACAHPNWSMGQKISVDSATLMNKGLELAEACWLFRQPEQRVEVVVHPQSIVHSMVRYGDGSVLAQLGQPDMRTPIAYALAWPRRIDAGVEALDLIAAARLDFEAPDTDRFPCLRIARECIAAGGSAMAVCNAANEEAVAAFLRGDIGFTAIAATIEETLNRIALIEPSTLLDVEAVDREARDVARQALVRRPVAVAT